MPITLDDLPQLVREYEEVCRGDAEQTGRRKEALRRMRDELGIGSEDEAEALVRKLQRRRIRMLDEYTVEYKRFKAALVAYHTAVKELP